MTPTEKIWHNGRLIPWEDAKIHVLSHVIHYGSAVFEGIRAYETTSGTAIFRLRDHMRRLIDSGRIYRMEIKYGADDLSAAAADLVSVNKMKACYIRPLVLRGYGALGVLPKNPLETYIACWEWGKYLGDEALSQGVDVCISSWNRNAPNTIPTLSKASGNYLSSQLIRMEAETNGYNEGIALDVNGLISEGSGENVFVARDGKLYTPPLASAVLGGITRDSVMRLAQDRGIAVIEQNIPREMLYIADEVFFTGTAVEITPVRSVDRIKVGAGRRGPITEQLQQDFFGIVHGTAPDRYGWLTPVSAAVAAR